MTNWIKLGLIDVNWYNLEMIDDKLIQPRNDWWQTDTSSEWLSWDWFGLWLDDLELIWTRDDWVGLIWTLIGWFGTDLDSDWMIWNWFGLGMIELELIWTLIWWFGTDLDSDWMICNWFGLVRFLVDWFQLAFFEVLYGYLSLIMALRRVHIFLGFYLKTQTQDKPRPVGPRSDRIIIVGLNLVIKGFQVDASWNHSARNSRCDKIGRMLKVHATLCTFNLLYWLYAI